MTSHAAQPWIYLTGPPGIGKLSIARELNKLIPGSKIIDNHLIIDLCLSAFERASNDYETLRAAIRKDILTAISSSPTGRQTTYIFTGSHAKDTIIGPLVARDYEARAKAGDVPFISIVLRCEEEENMRRATSPSRFDSNGVPKKLTGIGMLKNIRTREVFRFHCEHELADLDVTELAASDAANKIKQFVDNVMQAL